MKLIKIYLVVVTVLLVCGIGAGVYVWYTVQRLDEQIGDLPVQPPVQKVKEAVTSAQDTVTKVKQDTTTTQTPTATEVKEPVVVNTSQLPESQQALLKKLGITDPTFTITPAMITCAEKAVGEARLGEIIKGETPGPVEALKLLPCFKA